MSLPLPKQTGPARGKRRWVLRRKDDGHVRKTRAYYTRRDVQLTFPASEVVLRPDGKPCDWLACNCTPERNCTKGLFYEQCSSTRTTTDK